MEENQVTEVNKPLTPSTGGFTYSAAVVAFILATVAVSTIIKLAGLEEKSDGYIYLSYLASPIAIIISFAVVWKIKNFSVRKVIPIKCSWKYYIIAILLIYGLLFSLSWINDVSVKFFELFGYKPRESSSYIPDITDAKVIPAILVIAVLPALFEELLFRGALLNSCVEGVGTVRTVLIVGFCFALYHGSPEQTVYQFIAGCAFTFIAVRSGSIIPSVIMHFINNAIIVILSACSCFDESGALIISSGGNIALIVTSAVSLICALVWLVLDKKPLIKCQRGAVKSFFIYASVGIAILALIWIVSLFGIM
ncbi:MAG: CPBP family intramembrane metalloprotease [Clostridia bacterium]|nr:CPBP family intramembrane metalloprotease [Clostridia bacterium]